MPIRKELLPLYRTPEYKAARTLVRKRAGGSFDDRGRYLGGATCEQCGVVDRKVALRACGWWTPVTLETTVWMMRGTLAGDDCSQLPWHAPTGKHTGTHGFSRESCRHVGIVLTVAHLNHVAGDDRPENLKLLCQWCHLNYDTGHHAETRSLRKDRQRPLLSHAG